MDNPLSKAQLAELRREAASLADCRQRIERAKAAGLDVSEQDTRCHHFENAIRQLIEVYTDGNYKPKSG